MTLVNEVRQNFHVAIEAGGTAGEVLADEWIGLPGALGQAGQFGIGRAVEPLWVGERFGEIRLGEAEEFFFAELPLHSFLHWHQPPQHSLLRLTAAAQS